MTEWTLNIDTLPHFTSSSDVLEQVSDALQADPRALGAACSLNSDTGVLGATFSVEAATAGVAVDAAIAAFYGALASAGFDVERPGWTLNVTHEPAEQPVPA